MPEFNISINGLRELEAAIKRNPQKTITEVGNFLQRGMAKYRSTVINKPWRVGGSGGGVPVATGNLRDTHKTTISKWQARYYPTTSYMNYVHEGTKSVKPRPWLDYAFQKNERDVQKLADDMLAAIVSDLAK